MCSICNSCAWIYTCPGCSTRTCSLPCSTSHKTTTGCTGQRNKVAYVPMNKYSWGTMMNDYVFLEDVGRRVGDWGKEIIKGGYELHRSNGPGRGRGGGGRGRGRGWGGGHTKRDVLKMQLEARDVDMDVLPVGMERRKLNQSYWEPKSHTVFLTLEFKIYPPRDPLTPSYQSSSPPLVLLTHKNNMNTPLLNLAQRAAERVLSKKNSASNEWLKRFLSPDPDDPDSFIPPQFVMAAKMDPRAALLQKLQHRIAYYRFDPSQSLLTLLRHSHFVEFPTIEVWEEFNGAVVDVQGKLRELAQDEPKMKRRKLSEKAGKEAINGLLEGYGSDDDEERPEKPSGLTLLGGYMESDDEVETNETDDNEAEVGEDEVALEGTDDEGEVEIDPKVLLELMRHAHGDERWAGKIRGDDDVDWGASGDEEPE
ncbi:Box C/D snoRNA protein 1 [Termitomyces sp. J132]|nr:Box C/D snoRNA protein 1 [Termitomyces sp. J132]